ncbi:Alpha-amylase A type-1/2 [Aspergillus nanangensis]|uniref:Alpha-amylase A type-1/2 n=1 Tax=Aspergillus nanangensis TaxID=2582783 RepID=A0AAD4CG96_ASPNN|nr:Alpha-amylase A type-1/2 [Aspergillus nanangensis]
MRCDNPKCGCQPYPRKNRKVEITLNGAHPDQVCELHQPGTAIDVIFDIIDNALILRENINDPTKRYTSWRFSVQINYEHMQFVNLIGLPDSSLRLSIQLTRNACAARGNLMSVKEKNCGFAKPPLESRLDHNLYLCDWSEKRLEIFLPEEKLAGWKTVALILKTFKRVTVDQWSDIVWMKGPPPVAGLNWRAIEKEVWEEGMRSSRIRFKGQQKSVFNKQQDVAKGVNGKYRSGREIPKNRQPLGKDSLYLET